MCRLGNRVCAESSICRDLENEALLQLRREFGRGGMAVTRNHARLASRSAGRCNRLLGAFLTAPALDNLIHIQVIRSILPLRVEINIVAIGGRARPFELNPGRQRHRLPKH